MQSPGGTKPAPMGRSHNCSEASGITVAKYGDGSIICAIQALQSRMHGVFLVLRRRLVNGSIRRHTRHHTYLIPTNQLLRAMKSANSAWHGASGRIPLRCQFGLAKSYRNTSFSSMDSPGWRVFPTMHCFDLRIIRMHGAGTTISSIKANTIIIAQSPHPRPSASRGQRRLVHLVAPSRAKNVATLKIGTCVDDSGPLRSSLQTSIFAADYTIVGDHSYEKS
jgi:hypothetical protein